jgi:hypothetical protein
MLHHYARSFPIDFPLLRNEYSKKSCNTERYNCIAWAMGECHRPWWLGSAPEGYWPPTLPPDETIDNFIRAFSEIGYSVCNGAHHERRFEKIAIYADRRGAPTHAARQSWRGVWSSKLGMNVDITHQSLQSLESGLYGFVVVVMRRPWTGRRLVSALELKIKTSHLFGVRCFCARVRDYF